MSLEFLNNYNAQIMEDDMNYLREFLENVRKDPRVNNKMIVLTGPPMCGKTRLIEEIHQYMQEVYLQLPEYYEPILPLILLDGGLESLKKKRYFVFEKFDNLSSIDFSVDAIWGKFGAFRRIYKNNRDVKKIFNYYIDVKSNYSTKYEYNNTIS